jgi:hypothetical protein
VSEAWEEDGFEAENEWEEEELESDPEDEGELDPKELVPGALREVAGWDDLEDEP